MKSGLAAGAGLPQRPNKSSLEAVTTCRARCWKYPWVIDLDIKAFFDNVDHQGFVSRDLNGISVILYMIMIVATLLLIYKLLNTLAGFKLVKLRFKQELEMEIMKDIILFCGGDPTRLADRWRIAS